MAGLAGSVIELSNYLEQRISQKSAEYAAVRNYLLLKHFLIMRRRSSYLIKISFLHKRINSD
jgi:hypothetical protein